MTDSLPGHDARLAMDSLQLPDSTWTKQPPKPLTAASGLAKINSPEFPTINKDLELDDNDQAKPTLETEHGPYQSTRQLPTDAPLVDMDRQMAERRAAMGNYRATPRPVLSLDDPTQVVSSGLNVPTFERHDSNESFQLFSASTDSSHRERSVIGSFESNPNSQKSTSTPEREAISSDREDYGNGDQEDALVFDDEAQMQSPGSPQISPPMFTHAQPQKPSGEHAATATAFPEASQRPTDPQQPLVHYEDMEDRLNVGGASISEPPTQSHKYILSDYLPPEKEPEFVPPWTATAMFQPLIDFHTYKLHDAQLPAYLLLHLAPYINHTIPYARAMSILQQYHGQLISLQLYAQAAELRKLAYPDYEEVAEHGLYQILLRLPWCNVCRSPREGSKPGYCARCKQYSAECPICIRQGPASLGKPPGADDEPSKIQEQTSGATLWGWCQECGHGGHNGCLRIWWDDEESEGGCPTVGCLCDCMPGTRRDEIVKKLEADRKPKIVNKDEWKVGPSPAVQKARGLVGVPGSGKGPAPGLGGGRGAMSLGVAGRSGSGGKKVRIVAPEEEQQKGARGEGLGNVTSASVP